ncbi:hypothetical protein H9P43_001971 [Blastocladiella emersonii ATCC 22665]|nr:hypothetical protein H9P43_001971 [Blastocladiella emersonii ATCC 22665]
MHLRYYFFLVLAAGAVNAGQVLRGLPRCLGRDVTEKYGWMLPHHASDTNTYLKQSAGAVTLEINVWPSSNLTTYVAGLLLADVLGVAVTMAEYGDTVDVYKRAAMGTTNANLEVWPSNKRSLYTEYILRRGSVLDGGMIGYTGKIAFHINTALTEAHPSLIFDSWRSFTNPAVLAYFPAAATTQPARKADGSFLCDSATYPYCSNGIFVPSQCLGALFSTCKELWHFDPSYSPGEVEQRIVTLGLKLVVVYLGATTIDAKVAACAVQGNYGCIAYYWTPEVLPSVYNLSAINLPQARSECYAGYSPAKVGAPDNTLSCDWTVELLAKIISASVRDTTPHIATFLTVMALRDTDINSLLREYHRTGSATDTACAWIKVNTNIWSAWVPAPPAGFIRSLDQITPSDPIAIVVLAACAIYFAGALLAAVQLYRLRSEPSLRAQSPVFIGLILFGTCLIAAGVLLETLPATTAVVCVARTRLLSIGLTIVLASTLAKTTRIYFVFGNKRLQAKSLRTRRLMGVVTGFAVFDILLQTLWSEVGRPYATTAAVSVTSYTWQCAQAGTAAFATTVLLYIYHAAMLVAACWLSYQVRGVASAFNEARYIALASYLIAFAAVVVLPVVYLSIDFRAQFLIKCAIILVTLYGVAALLVVRPVLEAISLRDMDQVDARPSDAKGGVSAIATFQPGLTIREGSAAPESDKSDGATSSTAVGAHTALVRIGEGMALRKMGGLFRQWQPATMVLLSSPPSLQVYYDGAAIGTTYSADVFAEPLVGALHDRLDGCFAVWLGPRSHLVQTPSPGDANEWVRWINEAFNATARPTRSSSTSPSASTGGTSGAIAASLSRKMRGSGSRGQARLRTELMSEMRH